MVNDNSLSDSVLIQISVLEKDIKGLKDTLYSLEHSSESGRGYDRQVANIKNQIQQKTKQIQQFKRSINMNDAMDQLAMIGITQDARSVSEIQREFDYWDKGYEYFSERYLHWKGIYESTKEAKAKVDMENYKKKRDEANKKRKEFANEMSRTALNKDDDATEHGSIETYGKEKETETMPLEKDPVQAQDADKPLFFYEQNVGRKKLKDILENLKRRKQTLERAISGQEHYYTNPKTKQDEQELAGVEMQIKTVQNLLSKATHDEAPADVKDADSVKEREDSLKQAEAELERAKKNLARDPGNSFFKELVTGAERGVRFAKENLERAKRNSTHDEEPTNAVKDSYEMLKLCGIVTNDTKPLVGEVVEVDSPRVGQFTGRCVSVSSRWADIKILHMKNGKEPGIREGDIVSVNFEYIKV